MSSAQKQSINPNLKGFISGMAVWLIAAVCLIPAVSLICFSADDPDKNLTALSLFALYMSSAAAGIAAGAVSGKIMPVLMTSLTMTAVVLLLASVKPDAQSTFGAPLTALLYFLIAAVSMASGAATVFARQKRVSHRRRQKRRH